MRNDTWKEDGDIWFQPCMGRSVCVGKIFFRNVKLSELNEDSHI